MGTCCGDRSLRALLRVRQCLEVILASVAQGPATFDDIDKHSWLRSVRRVELVLLHEDGSTAPTDTLEWLRLRPYLTRHHHVRLGTRSDVARLRRWVSGKAVGLVLSGAAPLCRYQHVRFSAVPKCDT